MVFLLMGVTITLPMFEERWLAMLIGIGGVLIALVVQAPTIPLLLRRMERKGKPRPGE